MEAELLSHPGGPAPGYEGSAYFRTEAAAVRSLARDFKRHHYLERE